MFFAAFAKPTSEPRLNEPLRACPVVTNIKVHKITRIEEWQSKLGFCLGLLLLGSFFFSSLGLP